MSIKRFELISEPDAYGGKCFHLGAAIRAGLPVPRGFGISYHEVEQLIEGNAESRRQLRAELDLLAADSVAVRSSAVGEDAAESSFAGQHLSIMHLRTLEEIVDGIRKVRDSGHELAALAYREKRRIRGPVQVAVAVQTMVNPICAGVLFTQHPVTGTEEYVIESSWGLGEAVVAGLVTPDHYRLSRAGKVLERRAGDKDLAIRLKSDGGTEECSVAAELIDKLCLTDEQLAALHQLASKCRVHFGEGLDIEWAFTGCSETPNLLQCRPISTAIC